MATSDTNTSSTDIVIAGHTYSLLSEPPETSAIVLTEKDDLLGCLDLKGLVDELGHVGKFIRIAYNGVGAAGPKFQELQNEIQTLGINITKLCAKSGVTVSSFKTTSRAILSTLQAAYGYLLDGHVEVCIKLFSSLSELAKEMSIASDELKRAFENQEEDVSKTLGKTQLKRAEEAISLEKFKKTRIELEEKKKRQESLIEEHHKLEEEAKKERMHYERKEDDEISSRNSFVVKLLNVVTFGFYEDDNTERANEWKKKSEHKYKIEKEQRQLRLQAMQEMADFVSKLEHCRRETELGAVAVDALHEAAGALKRLSCVMLQASLFWNQLEQHCKNLSEPTIIAEIQAFSRIKVGEKSGHWTTNTFKKRAVEYYAKWVALHSVCSEYLGQIQVTQKDLYKYITENPTYEQSKMHLSELCKEFRTILKKSQDEIAKKDLEAEEEMKSLTN